MKIYHFRVSCGLGKGTRGALHSSLFSCSQNVLKKRDQVQAEYEAKLEAVALKREDRPKVST